jgi:uncharacterized DUF497 family protein
MRFEWDEGKRVENLRKHGIDFVGVEAVFDGLTVTLEDDRWDYGEQRLVTFGVLASRVVAVVHTESADVIRIISMRKATRGEEQGYFSTLAD